MQRRVHLVAGHRGAECHFRGLVVADLAHQDGVGVLAHQRADAVREIELRLRRSEEHTSELQSRQYLVCRLLLEKKKKTTTNSSGHTYSSRLGSGSSSYYLAKYWHP